MKRIQISAVCMALVLATSGCASTATSGNSSNGNGGSASSKPTEVEPTPSFSQDILFDGVSLLSREFEARLGYPDMGVPKKEFIEELPRDWVAPERCTGWAHILGTYGQPVSSERYFINISWREGVWGYIAGARTTESYRQGLVDSIDSCNEFSSQWEAEVIWNGKVSLETSEYEIVGVSRQDPEDIELSIDAVLARQIEDIYEKHDCLELIGPDCMATYGAHYQLHIISKGEYSLVFMFENENTFGNLEPPKPGIGDSDIQAIVKLAREFLDSNT